MVFAACFIAARAFPSSMGLDMRIRLGNSRNSSAVCGAGYSQFADSSGTFILDSGGDSICIPN